MKNSNRGCLIFLGIFGCLILILILIPNKFEKTGCRYALHDETIEVFSTDSVYFDNTGKESIAKRDRVYVKFIQKDSISIYRIPRYDWVIFRFVTEEVTGDRSNPFMLIVQKPEQEIIAANNSPYFESIPAEEKFVEAYPYCQYWIIKFDTDEVYGPFEQEEYLRKRKELGVGEELKLKFEREQK